MKNGITKLLICVSAIAILAGCAGKAPWYGNETDGYNLQYQFPVDRAIKYDAAFDMSITLERGDQQQTASAVASAVFGLKGKEVDKSSGVQSVETWAEKLEGKIDTQNGWKSVSLEKVLNKPFQMHMKPNGEVTGFGNEKELKVGLDLNGPGRFNIKDFFVYYLGNFFLKMPEEPKKIGDSWKLKEVIKQDLGNVLLDIDGTFTTTLAGYEMVDDINCLKLNVKFESLLEGGQEGGAMVLEGEFGGEAVMFFDYMNGRMAKYNYDMFGEATAAINGGGTFSYGIENKMKVSIIK